MTTLAVVTLANLKTPGVGGEDHILNRGGDTGLTDVRGSHDDPNRRSSGGRWGRSNSKVTGEDCKPDPETEAGVRVPSSS